MPPADASARSSSLLHAARTVSLRAGLLPPANPFSTRCVRPGAIDYIFAVEDSAAAIVKRLARNAWQGEIIGPHGAGKSTLLKSLTPHFTRAGRVVEQLQSPPRRMIENLLRRASSWGARTLVVIDGFEQFSPPGRAAIRLACRWRRAGLLITSHRSLGLPLLYACRPDEDAFFQVVAQLLPPRPRGHEIRASDIGACYRHCQGDCREALFALYDLYEQRDRQNAVDRARRASQT